MKRGNYKDYLSHGSKQKIPRTTAYNDRQKRIAQLLRELRSLGHNVEKRVSASHDSSLQRPPKKCYENPGFLANENISRKSSTENMNKRLYHQNSVPPEKFSHFIQNNTCIDQVCNEDPQCCTFNQPTFWPNSNQMYNENDTSESSSDEDTYVDESEPFYREMYERAKREKERDAFKKERELYRLEEPLCHCSTLSRGEIMYMVMQIGLDNDCTWKTVEQYSKLINFTHGKLRGIPDTKYKIQKYFPISDQSITFHMYCSRCKKNLGEQDGSRRNIMCTCGFKNEDPTKFFLSLNFENSFRDLLETSKNIEEKLNDRFNGKKIQKKGIEEIMDGTLYKELEKPEQPLSNKMNFSYTFSTDGCQSADSSKATIWPIFPSVNELKLNPADKSMLLLGVWVDLSDPDMNLFLEPFVEKANLLSSKGVEWKLNGKKVISKILPIMSSVDSVCRPKMMCMKQLNGYNGCYSCKIEGKLIDNQVKYVLTTDNVPESRTDEETKEQMIRAFLEQTVFDGVKGPSILMYLNYFRLVKGMIPDPLHAIHRGASAQHTRMLLHSCGEPYYVGAPAQIALINKRLKKIKPPSCITRTPRPIDQESLYKASEWRSWTELYSLVCLEGILDKDYLIDLAMHVKATHILLQESVLKSEIREAHSLYVRYNVTLQFDYG